MTLYLCTKTVTISSRGRTNLSNFLFKEIIQARIQDFSEGAPTPNVGGWQPNIWPKFLHEKYTQMKKIRPREGRGLSPKFYYVDLPLQLGQFNM